MRHGRVGRLVVFWDYDTQWGIDADRRRGIAGNWCNGALEFTCTERLLELHALYDVPACFAVVGAAALPGAHPYHDSAQIRRMHQAGHEIASHSFRHEWLPALGPVALRETLRTSKAALEDCIGASVDAFVPPYNQPYDHWRKGSVSWSERRAAPRERTDVARLCRALAETGFRSCRVAYRHLALQVADRLCGRRFDRPGRVEPFAGVLCVRLNVTGFGPRALALVDRCAAGGGIAVVNGHPHSLGGDSLQAERWVAPFLAEVARRRREGRLRIVRPRDLLAEA